MEVHSVLGPGYLEAVYHDAMDIELQLRAIPSAREVQLPVSYKGHPLGAPYRADFLCFEEVIVELKAKRALPEADTNQVVHYLKGSGKSVGLLLNFGEERLQYRRFVFWHGQAMSSESSAPSETSGAGTAA